MNQLFTLTNALRVLLAGYLCAATIALADDSRVLVSVVDAATSRPVADVRVSLEGRDGQRRSGVSDSAGEVEFDGLMAGFATVSTLSETYMPVVEPRVRILEGRSTPVMIRLQERRLDEIVAVGRATVADPDGAVSNSSFNRDQLRNNPGAGSDVMRALDGMPGLVSTGEFASFSVRGRGPRNNLIYVDGLPLDKVVHFDQSIGEEEDIGGGGRFSIFAPNSVVAAEFSPGGWSAAYGGRSGSLLKLDLAAGGPTPVASLRVDLAGVEVAYDGPSGVRDDTSVFFTARRFDFGRVFDAIDERDIGKPILSDVIFKSATTLDSNNEVELLLIAATEDFSRDVGNVLASSNFDDVSLVEAEQDVGLIGVTWTRLIGDEATWENRLYIRDDDKFSAEGEAFPDRVPSGSLAASVPVRERILTIDEQETEIGWRSDFSAPNQFGRLQTGIRLAHVEADYSVNLQEDWIRYVFEVDDPRPAGQNFVVWTPGNFNTVFEQSEIRAALFLEQTFDFDAWSFRPGLRAEYDGFSKQTLYSPRLSANASLTPNLRMSATAGLFFESPRSLTRALDSGNARLENERIAHVSVGMERLLGDNWSALVEAYYQDLDSLIVEPGRTSRFATNSGSGSNYGLDVVVKRRFRDGWSGNLTYSYNRQRLNDGDSGDDYTADFSREHFVSVSARWEINERWQLAWRWKYGSGRPDDDFIVLSDVGSPSEPRRFGKQIVSTNTRTLDDFHALNVRVDYRRPLGPVDVVAFLDVLNVYGGPTGSPPAFNYLNGSNVVEEDEALPIIGLIFERSW